MSTLTPVQYKKLHDTFCGKCRRAAEDAETQVKDICDSGDTPSEELLAASVTECDEVCDNIRGYSKKEHEARVQVDAIKKQLKKLEDLREDCAVFITASESIKKADSAKHAIENNKSVNGHSEFLIEILSKRIESRVERDEELTAGIATCEKKAYAAKDVNEAEVDSWHILLKDKATKLLQVQDRLKRLTAIRSDLSSAIKVKDMSTLVGVLNQYRANQETSKKSRENKLQSYIATSNPLSRSSIPAIDMKLAREIDSLECQERNLTSDADLYAAIVRKLQTSYLCVMVEGGTLVDMPSDGQSVEYDEYDLQASDARVKKKIRQGINGSSSTVEKPASDSAEFQALKILTDISTFRKKKNASKFFAKKLKSEHRALSKIVAELKDNEEWVLMDARNLSLSEERREQLREEARIIHESWSVYVENLEDINICLSIHEQYYEDTKPIRTAQDKYDGSLSYDEAGKLNESNVALEADVEKGGLRVADVSAKVTGVSGWSSSITDKPTSEDILQVITFLVSVIDDSKGDGSKEVGIKVKGLRWYFAAWFLNCDRPIDIKVKTGYDEGYPEKQLKAVFGGFEKKIIKKLQETGVSEQYERRLLRRNDDRYIYTIENLMSVPLGNMRKGRAFDEEEIEAYLGSFRVFYRDEISMLMKVVRPLVPGETKKRYKVYGPLIAGLQRVREHKRDTYEDEITGAIRRDEVSAYLGTLIENDQEKKGLSTEALNSLESIWKNIIEAKIERWINGEPVNVGTLLERKETDVSYYDEDKNFIAKVNPKVLKKLIEESGKTKAGQELLLKKLKQASIKTSAVQEQDFSKQTITDIIVAYKLKWRLRAWIAEYPYERCLNISEKLKKLLDKSSTRKKMTEKERKKVETLQAINDYFSNRFGHGTVHVGVERMPVFKKDTQKVRRIREWLKCVQQEIKTLKEVDDRRYGVILELKRWLKNKEKPWFKYGKFKKSWLGAAHVDLGIGDESELRQLYEEVLELIKQREQLAAAVQRAKELAEVARLQKEMKMLEGRVAWLQANNFDWDLYEKTF